MYLLRKKCMEILFVKEKLCYVQDLIAIYYLYFKHLLQRVFCFFSFYVCLTNVTQLQATVHFLFGGNKCLLDTFSWIFHSNCLLHQPYCCLQLHSACRCSLARRPPDWKTPLASTHRKFSMKINDFPLRRT